MTSWLSSYLPQGNQVRNQYYLVWVSFLIGIVAAIYLYMNTRAFNQYPLVLGVGFFIYFASISFAIFHIQTQAVSAWRVASIIGLTIILIFSLMWFDGKVTSHFYALFFPILILSLYWFGLAFLLFSFASIALGLCITVIFFLPIHNMEEFVIHMITLTLIPFVAWIMHKQAQPAAHLHQNFLDVLDLSPLPIFTFHLVNKTPVIRIANKPLLQLFNKDMSDFTGEPVSKLTLLEDNEEMTEHCIQALQVTPNQEPRIFLARGYNAQGEMLRMICVASNLIWQGELVGTCFLVDITNIEKQRSAMASSMQEGYMSTLAAGIVHDFRNVLTNIIGTAEVLAFTCDNETAKNQIQRIIRAGEQGSETITQLLQLSKTQNQGTGILASDMQKVFTDTTDLLRIQLPQHIQLHCKIEKNIPSIALSISELEQILMNLVNNATQAIKNKGEINIHVSLKTIDDDQGNIPAVKISVSDNGCGIAKKDLPFVTKNFWTSRQDEGGTGLGLAMVKHIVTQHTGK
ncbi:MAG: ATP-binding protein [Ghiorsea sp.]|nr:ATP-binding protein [Ghiorsea sp.]